MKKLLISLCILQIQAGAQNLNNTAIIGQLSRNQSVGNGFQVEDTTLLKGQVWLPNLTAVGSATDSVLSLDPITNLVELVPQAGQVIVSDSGWTKTGNAGTSAATNFIGTTDAADFVIKTNSSERARYTSNGKYGYGTSTPIADFSIKAKAQNDTVLMISTNKFSYGSLAQSRDTTTAGDFNNTTDPLGIAASGVKYPAAFGSNKGGFFRGLYVQIDDEILYISKRTSDSVYFDRAQFGTTVAAHANATTIWQVMPNSQVIDSMGRHGLNTNITDTYFNIAVGNDNWGGMVIGNHNVTQASDGRYGSLTETTKDFLQLFFFDAAGGLYIKPYNSSTGMPEGPSYQLQIGGHSGGLQGGMKIDGGGKIFFSELSGEAGRLVGNGTGIKPSGGAGSYSDLQGYASSPLRFGTSSNNSNQTIEFHPRVNGSWSNSQLTIKDNDGGTKAIIIMPNLPAVADTAGMPLGTLYLNSGAIFVK